jgi:hypothetical protein
MLMNLPAIKKINERRHAKLFLEETFL